MKCDRWTRFLDLLLRPSLPGWPPPTRARQGLEDPAVRLHQRGVLVMLLGALVLLAAAVADLVGAPRRQRESDHSPCWVWAGSSPRPETHAAPERTNGPASEETGP